VAVPQDESRRRGADDSRVHRGVAPVCRRAARGSPT
jgi:hypothetical protein